MLSSQLTDLEEEDILEELERLGSEEHEKIKIPSSITDATTRSRAEKQELEANKAKSITVSETVVVEKKMLEDDDLEAEWEALNDNPVPVKAKPKRKLDLDVRL